MLLQFQKGDIVRHLGLLDLQRTMPVSYTHLDVYKRQVFTWCVNVPAAWLLAYRTGMGIVPLYFCVQALELIKVVIGFALVKKGVWIHNIVAPVAEKEAAEK